MPVTLEAAAKLLQCKTGRALLTAAIRAACFAPTHASIALHAETSIVVEEG